MDEDPGRVIERSRRADPGGGDLLARVVVGVVLAAGVVGLVLVVSAVWWSASAPADGDHGFVPSPSPATTPPSAGPEPRLVVRGVGREGHTVLAEDWADGVGRWTTRGGEATTRCPADGACSLELLPGTPGTYTELTHDRTTVSARSLTFTATFQGHTTTGDTDAGFRLHFENDTVVAGSFTDGVTPNNGVALGVDAASEVFAAWYEVGAWHTFELTLDLEAGTVRAALFDEAGAALGRSSSLPLPDEMGPLVAITFYTVSWNAHNTALYPIGPVGLVAG